MSLDQFLDAVLLFSFAFGGFDFPGCDEAQLRFESREGLAGMRDLLIYDSVAPVPVSQFYRAWLEARAWPAVGVEREFIFTPEGAVFEMDRLSGDLLYFGEDVYLDYLRWRRESVRALLEAHNAESQYMRRWWLESLRQRLGPDAFEGRFIP